MFPEGRMIDFMILGAVALIVVGPKDLPVLMRKVGQFVARMRAMAAEFRASFDEIARQSELDELRREVEAMRASVTLPTMSSMVMGPEAKAAYNDIKSGLAETSVEAEQPTLPFGESPKPEDQTAKAAS